MSIKALREQLLNNILDMEYDQAQISDNILLIIQIQNSLINLSYLPYTNFKYLQLVVVLCRPQALIEFPDTSIISIGLIIIYWTYLLLQINFKKRQIALIRVMLDTILLNFFIETSFSPQNYVLITLIVLTQTIHSFVQEGTLDYKTCNLQQPKQLLINKFIRLLSILQILLNFSKDIQIIISALNSGILITKILIYRHKNQFIERFSLYSNVITLYYVLLIYLDFNPGGFSAHIIIVPFMIQICIQILNNKNFDQKNIQINDLFILYSQFHSLVEYKFINPKFDVDQYMQILKPKQMNDEAILYASLLQLQDKKIDCLRYLQQMQNSKQISLSRVNVIKMNKLYQKSSQQLYNLIDFQEANMADSIKQLLQSEELSEQIKNKLINLIRQKIEFLMDLQQQRMKKNRITKLTDQLLEYKQFLKDQYLIYGGDKQKSVYCFYLCEILNDYISANEINSVLAVNDERQNKLQFGQQYLSNKMVYLIIDYTNDLEIIKCSNNLQLLNLQQSMIMNHSINILIPQTIQQYHQQLIQQFFVNGTSKYLRKLNNNIYLDQTQNVTQVDFGLDIIYQQNNIQFIIFLQQLLNQQYMFLMNQQLFITNISLNLQQLLQQHQFDLLNRNIVHFIPNFDNYIINSEEYISIDNVELIRLKLTVNMQIYIKFYQSKPIYYIVYVDTVKTLYKTNTSIQQTVSDRESVDEDIIIFKPMDMEQHVYEEDKELSKVILDIENTMNANRIFSPKQSFQIPFVENESKFFESKKQQEESLQHDKQEIYVDNMQDFNDAASQMSSLQGVRRSRYYKKYELVQKSSELNAFSAYHKQFLIMFILGMIIQLILSLIQLFSINNNFTKLVSAVDLLQIKNFIYQPLASFLVTRWSIFNYNGYYNTKQITYDNWQSLLVFPYSNLDLGFDDLALNIYKVLNRPELQQFLEYTQVDLSIYIYTATGDNFTLSVRNAIDLLLNYQYVIKMRYIIEGTVVTDSPYVYFTYKNYIPMNKIFTKLNQQVYEDALNNTYNLENLTLTFLIIIVCLLSFFILLSLYYCIKIEGCIYNYLHIVRNIDKAHIDNELMRLQNLHDQVQKDPNILYNFLFNFEQREQIIEQNKDDETFKRSKRKQKDQGIQFGYYMIWLLLVLLIILLGTLLTYLMSNSFLDIFPNTIYLYMKFSEVGTDIPTMFAMREVLYQRNLFPYYTADDLAWILNQVKECVNTTQQFNKINYDKNNLIMSESFYNYLQEINDNNLCNYLDKNMTIKSKAICPLIMNGNMARGLRSLLIYMANFIQTDTEVNNLTSRSIAPYLELEATFLVSMVIRGINQKFNSDLYEQTVTLLNSLIIVSCAFIIFIILLILGVVTKYRQFIIKQYYLYQRSIYLMPRNTIFLDDVYERNLRSQFIFESLN